MLLSASTGLTSSDLTHTVKIIHEITELQLRKSTHRAPSFPQVEGLNHQEVIHVPPTSLGRWSNISLTASKCLVRDCHHVLQKCQKQAATEKREKLMQVTTNILSIPPDFKKWKKVRILFYKVKGTSDDNWVHGMRRRWGLQCTGGGVSETDWPRVVTVAASVQ